MARERQARLYAGTALLTNTVLNPQGTKCLGCVYIQPLWPEDVPLCQDAAYAADVGFSVRTSTSPDGRGWWVFG